MSRVVPLNAAIDSTPVNNKVKIDGNECNARGSTPNLQRSLTLLSPLAWLRSSSTRNLSSRVVPERLSSRMSIVSPQSTQLMRWEFDAGLETNHFRQMDNLQTMFGIVGAYDALDLSFETLNQFISEIKLGYAEVPGLPFHRFYHNFAHAMDVTQTLFAMLHFMEPNDPIMGSIEKAITLIAALGHDIHHPGVTNHYIVISKHQFALEYADGTNAALTTSVKVWGVLERMHAAETRRIVTKYNLLTKFHPSVQQRLEKLLMTCILNTDMAQHDGLLKHMNSLAQVRRDRLSIEDTQVLCSFFLHCADLSNAAKPWKTAERWAQLITKEFFEQGQAEKRQGMPVSPNCDAMTTMVPELQIKFINFAVLPCFSTLQTLFPKATEAVTFAVDNIRYWEAKRDESLTLEQRVILRAISIECNSSAEWNKLHEHKDLNHCREYFFAKTVIYHPIYVVLSVFAAIYIAFEPELRMLSSSRTSDFIYAGFLIVILLLSVIDTILSALVDASYRRSFYALLDVFSLATLIVEIVNYTMPSGGSWIFFYGLSELLPPRIVRIARAIRAVHFIPLLLFSFFSRRTEDADRASYLGQQIDSAMNTMTFLRKDIARLFLRLANKEADVIYPKAIEELVYEAYNGVDIPEQATRNVLAYFCTTPLTKNTIVGFPHHRNANSQMYGITRESFAHGIRQMELKHDGAPDIFIDAPPRTTERMVGGELSDVVIKRIFMVILVALLIIPLLLWTPPVSMDEYIYSVMDLHASIIYNDYDFAHNATTLPTQLSNELSVFQTTMQPVYLQLFSIPQAAVVATISQMNNFRLYDDAYVLSNFRYDQIEGVQVFGCRDQTLTASLSIRSTHDTECVTTVIFNLSQLTQVRAQNTMFSTALCIICIVLSVIYLDLETYKLVIQPIESMLTVVRRLAINPLQTIEVQVGEAQNEILLLQNMLAKIASLIQIGFGEAGAQILSGNMLEGDLNPMAEGKKIHAIFGFSSIRGFSEATEELKEEIMTFTNMIGEVVHRHVHSLNGHANKNIGQAFLLVWKIPSTSIEYALVNSNQTPQHMSPKKNTLLTVMEADNFSNRQPGRFTLADKALISFLKVQMEVFTSKAFHEYRHVLRQPNGQHPMGFGLHVGWAIEGAIGSRYKIDASYLSPDVNMSSRLEGATKQFGVTLLISHTFHKLLSQPIQEMCRLIDCVTVKGSAKPISLYTFDMEEVSSTNPLSTIADLKQIQKRMAIEFRIAFDEGVVKYLEGNWQEATSLIEHALCFEPEDGPSTSLLRVMREHHCEAPATWCGYRTLTEK
ncbi:hypothetical protein THRCLA_04178 [Thraustotheca clavata]|uniref:Phosphodiesterase n=1 Tax=Thraustotheca clavata TaxID=74557 RepID=A0A1V9ZZZ5_9STRA|nr:hypothetical protein THRCLA_04178 [Thraustotheca clavata]